MKKVALSIVASLIAMAGFAQDGEWITKFDNININGAVKLTIIEHSDSLPPKIKYELNGGKAENFSATVDDKGVLNISEKAEKGRQSITEVTLYTAPFKSIKAASADVWFKGTFKGILLDVELMQKARLSGQIDMLDLKIKLIGKSSAQLSGVCKYLTVEAASSNLIATDLDVISARVIASQKSNVDVNALDRIEVESSSSAKVIYGGDPNLVRIYTGFIEGTVEPRE